MINGAGDLDRFAVCEGSSMIDLSRPAVPVEQCDVSVDQVARFGSSQSG